MRYITFFLTVLILTACNSQEDEKSNFSYLPDAVGGYSTINIIADQNLWDYGLQNFIEPVFTKEIEGLLNKEPEFDLQKIRSKAFNRLFQRQRNILMFVSSGKVNSSGIAVKKDVYANGQIIVQVMGKSHKETIEVFMNKKREIFSLIDNHRTKIIQELARVKNNESLETTLSNNHGIKLTIPKSYALAIDSTNFFYVTKKAKIKCEKFNQRNCYLQTGIFTYFFDYSSKDIFTPNKFIEMRDSITKLYIEGSSQNDTIKAYMKVFKELPVSTEEVNINGKYGYEVKGWWDLKNGTMGGPFVSVAHVDELRNRVIVADAFVFGPNFNKRRFVKELEAICLSIEAN
ncbi:MAG: hypothetical protein CMP67_07440 [Flavobacteriales bacterium]|nr:hypothetical protein [Flavobacteriales bacterium]